MFEKYSKEAGKKQYLIPYFMAAHPGSDDAEMVNLAQWLKRNKFKVDQVQTFYPSPMSLATAMYHSKRNPLKPVKYKGDPVFTARTLDQRRRQKAILRYHDESNWDVLRDTFTEMGRTDLIGDGENALVPAPLKRGQMRKPQARAGRARPATGNGRKPNTMKKRNSRR